MSRLDQAYRETETSEAPDDITPAHVPDFDWEHSSGSEEYEPEESMGDKWDTIRLAEIAVKGLEDDLDMLKRWEGAKKDKLMSKWQRKLGTARSAVISAQTDFDAEFERLKNEGRSSSGTHWVPTFFLGRAAAEPDSISVGGEEQISLDTVTEGGESMSASEVEYISSDDQGEYPPKQVPILRSRTG